MNRIQELAAFKAALDEVGAWSDKYVADHVSATLAELEASKLISDKIDYLADLPLGDLTEWND